MGKLRPLAGTSGTRPHLLVMVCWLSAIPFAHANEIKFLPPLAPTRTVSKFPAEVRRLTPRTAKTLELKIFRIGDKQSDVLMHLYADTGKNSPTAHLDLYLWRAERFIRIHSFKIRQSNECLSSSDSQRSGSFELYRVQWLDLKQQTQPILAIRATNCTDYDEGKIRFFIFADGIGKPPKRQFFEYYFNSWASQMPEFVALEGKDKVYISQFYERTQGGPDYIESTHILYHWTGNQFTRMPFRINDYQ